MDIVGKPDQCHILRNTQALLLNGCEGRKGNDVIEGQNSIRTILLL